MPELLTPRSSHDSSGDETSLAPLHVDVACPDADTLVVAPAGEADVCAVPALQQALSEACDAGRSRIIVDLDQLAFMDASTLGVLVDARLLVCAAGGSLQVRCRAHRHRRLFAITGLDGMLEAAV